MAYNVTTIGKSPMMPEELQQAIEANTRAIADVNQSINFLVSEFIRPNAQQHLQSIERLDRLEEILELHNQAIVQIDERLDRVAILVETNTESLATSGERLEETQQLVAESGSQIAQLKVLQNQNAEQIDTMIRENTAFRESQQNQLATIISNARRIERLEQQAS